MAAAMLLMSIWSEVGFMNQELAFEVRVSKAERICGRKKCEMVASGV